MENLFLQGFIHSQSVYDDLITRPFLNSFVADERNAKL